MLSFCLWAVAVAVVAIERRLGRLWGLAAAVVRAVSVQVRALSAKRRTRLRLALAAQAALLEERAKTVRLRRLFNRLTVAAAVLVMRTVRTAHRVAVRKVLLLRAFLVKGIAAAHQVSIQAWVAAVAQAAQVLTVPPTRAVQAAQPLPTTTQAQRFRILAAAVAQATQRVARQALTQATVAVTPQGQTQLPIVVAAVAAVQTLARAATAVRVA